MAATDHKTGTVRSGDVTLFYRRFGRPGECPILICHGANYYDSYDWIDVATALGKDREVVAWDTRGFGESTWSPSKDYSHDALMGDINALLDEFGWATAVVMGHSMGGGTACLYAARFPTHAAGLVLVDHCPTSGPANPSPPTQSINKPATVFPSIEAAQKAMSRDTNIPPDSSRRARLDSLLKPVDGGFVFKRDPDFNNRVPVRPEGWNPQIVVGDMWAELKTVKCPVMIVRATRSDRYGPGAISRVKTEFPDISMVDVESGHDVAAGTPDQLIDCVLRFMTERVASQNERASV